MDQLKDIEIDILPTGEIRFCRCNKETNDELLSILKELGIENLEELKEFFNGADKIEQILGDEPLCG